MIEKLQDAILPLGYPLYRQGSLNDARKYPESFFTFWNFSTEEMAAYDNEPTACEWGYWLYFYSTDPELVETEILKAKNNLKAAGFEVWEKGEDVKSDTVTHTGRMLTVYYNERY